MHAGRRAVAVIEEVGRRGGLQRALANRDDESLLPILEYIEKNISKPRHTVQMVNIANRIATCTAETPAPARLWIALYIESRRGLGHSCDCTTLSRNCKGWR